MTLLLTGKRTPIPNGQNRFSIRLTLLHRLLCLGAENSFRERLEDLIKLSRAELTEKRTENLILNIFRTRTRQTFLKPLFSEDMEEILRRNISIPDSKARFPRSRRNRWNLRKNGAFPTRNFMTLF